MKQIDGQLSLFDIPAFLGTPDINDIPEAEAVRIVGERIGQIFAWNASMDQWESKRGRLKLSLKYGRFVPGINEGRLFLGAGWSTKDAGGGAPLDGIEQAVKWFEKRLEAV